MKGGNRTANLRLHGDMLGALKHKNVKGDGVQTGIYTKRQAAKADGHCNYSGESELPERRFTPDEEHNYNRDIMKKLKTITKDYVDDVGVDIQKNSLAKAIALAASKAK